MSTRLCVLYGLNEGPAIGRQFTHACKRAGFELTRDPHDAAIIFAHSGGCYLVPSDTTARIIMVGLPYWPDRSLTSRLLTKLLLEWRSYRRQGKTGTWIMKQCTHLRYAIRLKDGFYMMRNQAIGQPWDTTAHQLIIRNRSDAYCTPNIAHVTFRGPRSFLSLPGGHDDCWINPEPYIRLLQ